MKYFNNVLLRKGKVKRGENPIQYATRVLHVAENILLNYMESTVNRQRRIRSISSAAITQGNDTEFAATRSKKHITETVNYLRH